jgi:putative PEP-CTERM system TPR-repeat lipoprotein
MRRALLIGLPVLAILGLGAGGYVALHHGNLLADAHYRMAHNDAHGAEIDLDTYLRGHPGNAQASFDLGQIKLAENSLVAAERLFRAARKGGYNPAAIVTPLGETYLQQHRFEDVLNDFPADHAPPGGLADTLSLRASAYLALHQTQQARQAADQAVAAAPDKPGPEIVAARIDAASNDPAAAEARVDHLLARDPKLPDALLLKIDLLMHRNDLPGALRLAQALLAANPNSPAAKMAAARALGAMGRDVEAMKLVNDVVRRLPRDIGANYLKLRLSDRQRDFVAADAALSVLLPVIDELPQGEYFAAIAKLGVNEPAQAQEAAAKYVAQNPGDPAGLKVLAFAELALNRGDRVEELLAPLVASGHPDADTLDLVARAHAMRGDMKGAEQELARASALAPNNDDILNRLGAARVELGDTSAGEADLRRSLAQTPDQPRAAAALVQTALAAGDIKSAQDAVDVLRRAVGATEEVGVLDGQVKIAELDLKGAEAVYQDTLKRFPDSRQATLGLVQVESRLGEAKTARNRLIGWMTAHPTDKPGLKMLVTGDMAGRDVAGAIAAVEAAHGAAPGDIDVDVALATLYLAAKMPGKTVDLIDRSTEAGGEPNPALLPLKGQALIDLGRFPAAEEVLNHAVEATPNDVRPRFGLIELKMNQKDYDAARRLAQQGLEAFPGNVRMQEALVAVELKAHGIKAALQVADTLKNDPRNMPAALLLPGTALAASGDAEGAARAFLDAYHTSPSEQNALIAAAALARAGHQDQDEALLREWTDKHPDSIGAQRVLAGAAITGHRNEEAVARLNRILAVAPSDSSALNNMAWIKLQSGDRAGARNLAQRAYYLSPGAETQDTLGWILASGGDSARALPMLEQAAAMKPTQQILYHYAFALAAQSRPREAREVLDKALGDKRAFDERADAEKLRARLGS